MDKKELSEEEELALEKINSAGIAEIAREKKEVPAFIKKIGADDEALILYRWSDGLEIISTNGDPIGEADDDFAETRELFDA